MELEFDQSEIKLLETEPIDHDTQRRIEKEVNKWKREFELRFQVVEQRQDDYDQRQGNFEKRLDDSKRRQDNSDQIQHDLKQRQDISDQRQDKFDDRISTIEEILPKITTCKLSNCLPDDVSDVFGRLKEIGVVVEAIQSGNKAVVLITGGPGFGKNNSGQKSSS